MTRRRSSPSACGWRSRATPSWSASARSPTPSSGSRAGRSARPSTGTGWWRLLAGRAAGRRSARARRAGRHRLRRARGRPARAPVELVEAPPEARRVAVAGRPACPRGAGGMTPDGYRLVEGPPGGRGLPRTPGGSPGLSPPDRGAGRRRAAGQLVGVSRRARGAGLWSRGHGPAPRGRAGWYFHVVDMAVLPHHQRRGLGDLVLGALLGRNRTRRPGAPRQPAGRRYGTACYAQHGFVETGPTSVGMDRTI